MKEEKRIEDKRWEKESGREFHQRENKIKKYLCLSTVKTRDLIPNLVLSLNSCRLGT